MCLISFAWQPQQQQLIVAANRDEFFKRPAAPMAEWPEHPGLFAGKDLEQGGTWLGVTRNRRFAALTNIRAPGEGPQDPLSRGHLVLDFLTSDDSAESYMMSLSDKSDSYGLFNLLCFDGQQLWYANNHPHFDARALDAGHYGLSNAHLDTPWPKTQLAKQQLQQWLNTHDATSQLPGSLLDRREPFADDQLPQTGVPFVWEKMLSSQFIHTPTYGTRCSSAISISEQHILLEEISWDEQGENCHEFRYQIRT